MKQDQKTIELLKKEDFKPTKLKRSQIQNYTMPLNLDLQVIPPREQWVTMDQRSAMKKNSSYSKTDKDKHRKAKSSNKNKTDKSSDKTQTLFGKNGKQAANADISRVVKQSFLHQTMKMSASSAHGRTAALVHKGSSMDYHRPPS